MTLYADVTGPAQLRQTSTVEATIRWNDYDSMVDAFAETRKLAKELGLEVIDLKPEVKGARAQVRCVIPDGTAVGGSR